VVFRQFIHDDLGCASYLVADEDAGMAAVVDPALDIEPYLELARFLSLRVEHVLETHTHADHVSGHGRLSAATGAEIHIHRAADPTYEHAPFDDGWVLELGRIRVRALHTPGHRPEHTAFLVTDTSRSDRPWAVMTGDSLFVGDVARPDLAVDREEGARGMFRSLHGRLLELPPETEVWPGHIGGSLCGGPGIDKKVSSTIGFEHSSNDLLAEDDEDRFVERVVASLGPQPPNFRVIVDLNRGPLETGAAELLPLSPRQVEQRAERGAMVVDVRTDLQYDEAHVPGSICITALHGGFGTKLAWLADPEGEIVLVGRDDDDARLAARLAATVGIRTATGFLAGGMTSWRVEGRPVKRITRVDLEGLRERRDADPDLQVLDVREDNEWREGHIAGSLHEPWHDIDSLPRDVDRARPVAVVCASGQRSAVAAGLVQRLGVEDVLHVAGGGVPGWIRAGYESERSAQSGATA
jgi:hydroxyacylglutathione hydrolase